MPARNRLQLHLSTALILMFVAGGLIWANVQARISQLPYGTTATARGWPFTIFVAFEGKFTHDAYFDPLGVIVGAAIDTGIALLILAATWFLAESLIRRRSASAVQSPP